MSSEEYPLLCFCAGSLYRMSILGRSDKGCYSFKAKNIGGKDAIITTWKLDVDKIRYKCPMSCKKVARPEECDVHLHDDDTVYEILQEFQERANYLIAKANHHNLVRYLSVRCDINFDEFTVCLVQEYVEGENVKSLCEQNKLHNVSCIAKEVTEALEYLHGMNVTHDYLKIDSIFLDKSGVIRVADYDLVPYLMYLNGNHNIHEISDFNAMGLIIKSLRDTVMISTDDFIDKCCSGRFRTHLQVYEHPFLSNDWAKNRGTIYGNGLLEHFEIEKWLGGGNYGVVLQAKHNTDKRSYAMKFIEVPKDKKELEQMEREAEIISRINHRNIVRYITSWKQPMNITDLEKYIEDDDFIETSESSSSVSKKSKSSYQGPKIRDTMIIQMELCIMNLRELIDTNISKNNRRVWKMFSQICLGLNHLHQKGIIHRDINPKNILLDSNFQIKITGKKHAHYQFSNVFRHSFTQKVLNFGMATTTVLALQQQPAAYWVTSSTDTRSSQTGLVGTPNYGAPELSNGASKSVYGVKVDIYSFGIVFFEMCHPPFDTQMERSKVLTNLRDANIKFPDYFKDRRQVNAIKQMLNHDPMKRLHAKYLLRYFHRTKFTKKN